MSVSETLDFKASFSGGASDVQFDLDITLGSAPTPSGTAITSISGTVGGVAISGLDTTDFAGLVPPVDNLILSTSPYVDGGGIAFDVGTGGPTVADEYNLYANGDQLALEQETPSTGDSYLNSDSVTDISTSLCFAFGTRIRTLHGEVAVERLAIGDIVVTAAGEMKPIRWIGRRTIDLTRHGRPEWVQPVRIEAGALGEGLPTRDLFVSPEHALWLRAWLVPARELINGATIRQEARSRVEYFHVELDSHEVLLAEGAPAESYLDCDNRSGFDNAPDGVVRLQTDWSARATARPLAPPGLCAELQAELAARAVSWGRAAEIEAYDAAKRARARVARTNVVRNPRAEGGRLGRLGAEGEAPQHWFLAAPEGIEIELLGRGEEDGLPFLDLRFAGSARTAGACGIHPEPGGAAAARTGQDWTVSTHLRRIGGSLAGIDAVKLYFDENDGNGGYLDGEAIRQDFPTDDNLTLQRFAATRRLARPDVAGVTAYVQIVVERDAPVDLTLRIAGMQIERGAYASDLMLPPVGEIGAATRTGPIEFRGNGLAERASAAA